jgi:uncharacterized phage protein (TIGR02220 family)
VGRRIRSIKPEFWEDELVARLSDRARLLFIATWSLADDDGRLRAGADYLRGQVFWGRPEVTTDDVDLALGELVPRLLTVWVNAEQRYASVNGWAKHQRIDRPSPSVLPAQDEVDSRILANPREGSRLIALDPEGKGREGEFLYVGLAPDASSPVESTSPIAEPSPPSTARPVPPLLIKARAEAALYIEWFNRTFARQFSVRGDNVQAVKVLLADGFTQGGFRLVAEHLHRKWGDDEKMQDFLRPSTLLRRRKFGEYLEIARSDHPELARRCDALDTKPLEERLVAALGKTPTGSVADAVAKCLRDAGGPPLLRAVQGGRPA